MIGPYKASDLRGTGRFVVHGPGIVAVDIGAKGRATQVAKALNDAYNRGRADLQSDMRYLLNAKADE